MRLRAVALGIFLVSVIDLVAMLVFWSQGWLHTPVDSEGLLARLAVPLTFTILAIAVIGSAGILATSRKFDARRWAALCFECGREPSLHLDFCNHCGAA